MKTRQKLAFSASSIAFLLFANSTLANTLCVDPKKPSSCSATIQEAIIAASPGDKINIAPGTYSEKFTVDKENITIKGSGCASTTIDGCIGGNCTATPLATISVAGVSLQNMSMSHTPNAININTVDNATITGNCFYDSGTAIKGATNNSTISKNLFKGNPSAGIDLLGNNNTVTNNKLLHTGDACIVMQGDNIQVSNNILDHCGLISMEIQGNFAIIEKNQVSLTNIGIASVGDNTTIAKNSITGNIAGIFAFCSDTPACTGGSIRDNKVTSVSEVGILVDSAKNMEISNNTVKNSGNDGIAYLGDSSTIKNNSISSVGGSSTTAGLFVQGSGNSIIQNKVTDNSVLGIANVEGDNNTYAKNIISQSIRSGLFILSGAGNTVDDNKVTTSKGEGINNAGTNTNVTNNTAKNNRTDFCNQGSLAAFSGNKFGTGDQTTPCLVDNISVMTTSHSLSDIIAMANKTIAEVHKTLGY